MSRENGAELLNFPAIQEKKTTDLGGMAEKLNGLFFV